MPQFFLTPGPEPLVCTCPTCRADRPHAEVGRIGRVAGDTARLALCAACGKPFLAWAGPAGPPRPVPPEEAARLIDPPVDPRNYQGWVERFDRIGPADREAIRNREGAAALPGVALRLFDDTGIVNTTDDRADRRAQFHPAVAEADGDIVLFLHADAHLRPHATHLIAEAARRRPEAMLFYGDEDRLSPDGVRHAPFFKPAFSRDLFQAIDLFPACFAVRRCALTQADTGHHPRALAKWLAGSLAADEVHHIPHVLHHATTDAAAARRRAMAGIPAAGVPVSDSPVSVLIPTHAQPDLVARCIDSLYRLNPATPIELIVVDNSRSPDYRRRLETLIEGRPGAAILDWPEPFNFSRMMNAAAARAGGHLLCFLNDDTEGITPGWLGAMAGHALRAEIGAVGARLLYPDGAIQHAGVVLTGRAGAAHLHHGVPAGSDGHGGLAALRQEVSAVTAACLVVEAAKFHAVGGFDEAELPVNFSDVDLCLKLRGRGWRTLYLPEATLHHHESVSRRSSRGDAARLAGQRELHRLVSRWGLDGRLDPYHNPNLSTVLLDGAFAWPPRVAYPWARPGMVADVTEGAGADQAVSADRRNRLRLETAVAAVRDGRPDDALPGALAVLLDAGVRNRVFAAAAATFALGAERAGAAELAERILREAVRRDPIRLEHSHNLANFLARQDRRADAAALFAAILVRNPYVVESVRSLAALLRADGALDHAVAVLAKGCADNPADTGLWIALVETAWEAGDYVQCLGAAVQAAAVSAGVVLDRAQASRTLAYAAAVFEVLGARHRAALAAERARTHGLADGPGGGPAADDIAARRGALMWQSEKSPPGAWIAAAEARVAEAVRRCDPRADAIGVSIIMPVFQPSPEDLAAAVDSVRRQSHGAWELCIALDGPQPPTVERVLAEAQAADPRIRVFPRESRGHIAAASNTALEHATQDYVALLDQDDELHPEALRLVADAILRGGRPHILFSDEDRLSTGSRRMTPHFKKGWDPLLLLHQNCVSHLGVYRRDAMVRVGGFRVGTEGSQDHDLVLRLTRADDDGEPLRAVHIPHVLYHWRTGEDSTATSLDAKPYALSAGRRAVQDHVDSAFPEGGGRAVALRAQAGHRVLWPRAGTDATVSVVLTEPVSAEELQTVADLLRHAGAAETTEIMATTTAGAAIGLGLDNATRDLGTLGPNRSPAQRRRHLTEGSRGTFLLFCHPAVRFDAADWIDTLVRFAAATGVAAAGPKLVDGAGLVISAGIVPDRRVLGWRLGFRAGALSPGYFGRLAFPCRAGLLDEVCVLLRRDALEDAGGLRDLPYMHALDLLDAMMRLEPNGGLAVDPNAVVRLDAASRFNAALLAHADPVDAWAFRQRWSDRLDPARWHNPNLSLGADCFRPSHW